MNFFYNELFSLVPWRFIISNFYCTSINDVVGSNWWQMTSVTCSHMTIVGYLSHFCLKFTNTVFHKWCHHEMFFNLSYVFFARNCVDMIKLLTAFRAGRSNLHHTPFSSFKKRISFVLTTQQTGCYSDESQSHTHFISNSVYLAYWFTNCEVSLLYS
jgi:hypothetical protein